MGPSGTKKFHLFFLSNYAPTIVFTTFSKSECLYNFVPFDTPMNVTSSTSRLSSTKYVPRDLSTESNPESSRWDMKFTDISLFVADIKWRLDPTGGSGSATWCQEPSGSRHPPHRLTCLKFKNSLTYLNMMSVITYH